MAEDSGQVGDEGEDRRRPLSKMRRAIAASMNMSAQVPQFTLDRTIDLSAAAALRDELRAGEIQCSWEDVLTAACARALRDHPHVNASFDDDAIIEHSEIHVGLATAVDGGLVGPAVLNADRRNLNELVAERRRLRAEAAEGRLRGQELYGATFTISNLGPYGVDRFRALVIPPQAAILACGRVFAGEGEDAPRINVSLSCDHRVLDGAPAAEFLATICGLIEEPLWLRDLA